jgi:hypothetical protein
MIKKVDLQITQISQIERDNRSALVKTPGAFQDGLEQSPRNESINEGRSPSYLDNKKCVKAVRTDLRHRSGYLDSRLRRFSMV